MKLTVEIGASTLQLEISSQGETWRFRMEGAPEREAQVREAEPGIYSVLLDGRSYDARVEAREAETEQGLVVVIGGQRFEVAVRDPRRWARKPGGVGHEGRHNVTSPMPGKIVRVLVAPGDAVVAGQGLLVVEAMKMQNEMKALKAGRVVAVAAREGATVSAGEVLATIE
jgi:biotin carboxyl carrier protein